jgi:hypothetical protein
MEVEGLLEQLRISYGTMYEATRKDLKSLTADREKVRMTSPLTNPLGKGRIGSINKNS